MLMYASRLIYHAYLPAVQLQGYRAEPGNGRSFRYALELESIEVRVGVLVRERSYDNVPLGETLTYPTPPVRRTWRNAPSTSRYVNATDSALYRFAIVPAGSNGR